MVEIEVASRGLGVLRGIQEGAGRLCAQVVPDFLREIADYNQISGASWQSGICPAAALGITNLLDLRL